MKGRRTIRPARSKLRELGLNARVLNSLGLSREPSQLLNLLANLFSASRERHRFEHRLQPLALALLHLFQLFRIGQIRRRLTGHLLGAFESVFEAPGSLLQRTAHGEAEKASVTIEGVLCIENYEVFELVAGERHLAESF